MYNVIPILNLKCCIRKKIERCNKILELLLPSRSTGDFFPFIFIYKYHFLPHVYCFYTLKDVI